MRWTALALLALLALPASAKSEPPLRGECRKLTNQIDHFEGVERLAQERDNELWERETRRHIERLERRRETRCPQFRDDGGAAAAAYAFGRMMGKAAKAAARYFLMPF